MSVHAPGVRLRGVDLALSGRRVFEGLSLDVAAGRWHAVLGRSGVGKSSLLRLVAGLQVPDAGSVTDADGAPLAGRIARMAQDDGLLPWLPATENVQLGPRLRGARSARTRHDAAALLDRVGLGGRHGVLPASLSGGMRQRVALARTLLEGAPLVLMDEPFSRLDAITRRELQTLSLELLAGRTVVLVTHDPGEALRLADAVTVLRADGGPTWRLGGRAPRADDDPERLRLGAALWTELNDARTAPA